VSSPVIALITDRLRLATVLNTVDRCRTFDVVVEQVHAAARAGVHLVQVRERDLEGRELFDLAYRCVCAVRGTGARIIVNDRLDIAMAAGAHGVHLRETSVGAARVRSIAPRGFLVGRSVHDLNGARRAVAEGGVDYLVFGPVFATHSKPGQTEAGIDALREVADATAIPVLAVGGVTLDRVGPVMSVGAAGIAAIGLFACAPDALNDVVTTVRDGDSRFTIHDSPLC